MNRSCVCGHDANALIATSTDAKVINKPVRRHRAGTLGKKVTYPLFRKGQRVFGRYHRQAGTVVARSVGYEHTNELFDIRFPRELDQRRSTLVRQYLAGDLCPADGSPLPWGDATLD